MQENSSKLKLIASMAIFGTIGLFVRHISLPSSIIALCRGVIGTLFLLALLTGRKARFDKTAIGNNLLWLLLSGGALGFNWILLFESYRYTSVAVSTLCYYLAPILVILASPLVLKEKLTLKKGLCVVVALAGMVCLSGVLQSGTPQGGELKGILFGLAAAVLYACIVLINKQFKGISALEKTILQLGISAIVLLPYCLLTVDLPALYLSPKAVILLLFVGVVHTGLAYALYFGSLGAIRGQTAAILSYIDPLMAVAISVFVLGESMTALQLLGGVLVISSVISVLMGKTVDKLGKLRCLMPAAVVGVAGLLLMYLARAQWFVMVAGIVMMAGGMVVSACCHGLIRDYTPEGKAGLFQGIRILFQVLIPMVTGPYIGVAVIRNTGMTYEDLGTVKQVPTAEIFFAAAIVLVLVAVPVYVLKRLQNKEGSAA